MKKLGIFKFDEVFNDGCLNPKYKSDSDQFLHHLYLDLT